ncbi:TonB-dependent receptor [Microbulbifer magnicolonia]|uniref:TonB-dependent receptor n=1 Tax=Microbulbifer magnicolonia TaxID=3109744 RepID=UPI002B4077B2|nr:TonB-dependent receptor [Microbulbifer sp. GG15]
MGKRQAQFKNNLLAVAVAAVIGVGGVPAMAQVESATVQGQLQRQVGELPAGVAITAVDIDRGYTKTVKTGEDGSFIFAGLKPGSYDLKIGDQVVGRVELRVGQKAIVDLNLQSQDDGTLEQVTVTGARVEQFSGGEVGTNITPEMMERLPQNNRNFLAFADLAPGVQVETASNGNVSLRGGAQHQRNINVFLDGVSQKDYVLKGGVTGQDSSQGNPFPQNAIGEYKVITQNYKAEFDQVGSTAITAVTRSGTNEFQGDVFFDYTDEGLREAEPNERDGKTESLTEHSGFLFSGPIIEDKLHFLLSYEGKDIATPIDIPGGSGVDLVELPSEYQGLLGRESSTFEEDLIFGKIDWHVNENQEVQASLKLRDESDVTGFGGANTISYGVNREVKDHRLNVKHTYYADDWQNEFRLTYEEASWNPRPYNDDLGTRLETGSRQSILNLGGGQNFQDKGQKGWGLKNDFTWLALAWNGSHVIKGGIKFKKVELNTIQQLPYNPQYFYNVEFNGAGEFDLVQPYKVEWGVQIPGTAGGAVNTDNTQLGFYIQDDWDVTDSLTLNIGVRWDYEETPAYKDFVTPEEYADALRGWANLDNANYDIEDYISTGKEREYFTGAWQPRLGFTYIMDEEQNHTLFGGYGRSYDRNQFDFVQLESMKGSFERASYLFAGDPDNPCDTSAANCVDWDPAYLTREGLGGLTTNTEVRGERFLLNNELKMPYSDQMSVGLRSSLGEWSTEISASYIESNDGFQWLLGNRRENGEFLADGTKWGQPWAYGVPGWGNLLISSNDGQTRSKNVYMKLSRPHIDNWGVNVAYTFSDAEENRTYSEVFALDYETVDDYGWNKSVGVPDHRIVFTGTYDLPWDIFLSGKYTWASEKVVQYLDCTGGNTECFFGRLEPDTSDYQRFDLSLMKEFASEYFTEGSRFRIRLDVQNLFNHSNFQNFVLNPAAEDFGDPQDNTATSGGRRQLKLSAGYSF